MDYFLRRYDNIKTSQQTILKYLEKSKFLNSRLGEVLANNNILFHSEMGDLSV